MAFLLYKPGKWHFLSVYEEVLVSAIHEYPPFYTIYEFTEQLCMTNIHTCGKIKITVCKRKTYENKSLLLTVGR